MPDSDSDSDADEMLQYKVILLGDGTVGKTSIAMRFTNDTFGQIYKQVLGSQCCPAAGRHMPARAAKLSADALSPPPPPPPPPAPPPPPRHLSGAARPGRRQARVRTSLPLHPCMILRAANR